MDAAMDEQMKQLAEDREFQRELEEAAEDLPLNMKRCPSCGAEHSRPFTDLCGSERCDAWALDGKYRRWDAETEVSIRMVSK
jgi:DNA repair exonuclease SbcCD ATPase subunit